MRNEIPRERLHSVSNLRAGPRRACALGARLPFFFFFFFCFFCFFVLCRIITFTGKILYNFLAFFPPILNIKAPNSGILPVPTTWVAETPAGPSTPAPAAPLVWKHTQPRPPPRGRGWGLGVTEGQAEGPNPREQTPGLGPAVGRSASASQLA